ncbi:MAG: thioredoxin family protein [Odoribacter splanchnicus]
MQKIIKFSTPWYGPCQALKPVFEKIRQEYEPQGISFQEVNADDDPEELTKTYRVMSVPTILFLDGDGKVKDKTVGLVSEEELRKRIRKLLS